MTNQEKNEAVARKMGWTQWESYPANDPSIRTPHWTPPMGGESKPVPAYCTSIEAAWGILDKYYWRLNKEEFGVRCILGIPNSTGFVEWTADTAPMAIVDAFLKVP